MGRPEFSFGFVPDGCVRLGRIFPSLGFTFKNLLNDDDGNENNNNGLHSLEAPYSVPCVLTHTCSRRPHVGLTGAHE